MPTLKNNWAWYLFYLWIVIVLAVNAFETAGDFTWDGFLHIPGLVGNAKLVSDESWTTILGGGATILVLEGVVKMLGNILSRNDREAALIEGRHQGIQIGQAEVLARLVADGKISSEDAEAYKIGKNGK